MLFIFALLSNFFSPLFYTPRFQNIALFTALQNEFSDEVEDNIFSPWSLEDDKTLYEGYKHGKSNDELCEILRRGPTGVKSRIKHLNNPDHRAFRRLFGSKTELHNDRDLIALRTCRESITRILWEPYLSIDDFSFVYTDRFNGDQEMPANSPNLNVKGKERLLILAIPEHRIKKIKYKKRVIWSKAERLDLIFGGNKDGLKLENVINTYDTWLIEREKEEVERLCSIQGIPVYLMLEGGLADFESEVIRIFKRKSAEVSPKKLWRRLETTDSFYTSLPWCPGGKYMWQSLQHLSPKVVTTKKGGEWVIPQKYD
mmetsp:Transcript_7899/g.8043  ORF Transcript_7899/g.8043 Transcript_7899/m.8043 type:complete len:314 (-) Transcript_7899:148-1089(-)